MIVHRPLPVDDPRRRKPDISRARALLGWEPRVPLQQGLEATAAWFAKERHGDWQGVAGTRDGRTRAGEPHIVGVAAA